MAVSCSFLIYSLFVDDAEAYDNYQREDESNATEEKAIWPCSGHYHPTEKNFMEFISFLEDHHVDLTNVKRCAVDDDSFSSNIETEESMAVSSITTTEPEETNASDVNVNVPNKKTDAADTEEPMFNKWTSGTGPRIGCVRDYPAELQSRALEQVNLSPRLTFGRRALEQVNLSPRLTFGCRALEQVNMSPRLTFGPGYGNYSPQNDYLDNCLF